MLTWHAPPTKDMLHCLSRLFVRLPGLATLMALTLTSVTSPNILVTIHVGNHCFLFPLSQSSNIAVSQAKGLGKIN